MKTHYSSLLLLFLLFISGCSNDEPVKIDIYSTTINVKGKVLVTSDRLIDPWTISCMDSLLVLANKKGEPLIEVYNTKGELLKKLLKKGKGASDIRMVGGLQRDLSKQRFYVGDLFDKKIIMISVKNLLGQKDYQASTFVDFKKLGASGDVLEKAYVLNNSFVGESSSPKGRIVLIDSSGKKLTYKLDFPKKVDPTLSDEENVHLYSGTIKFSPNNKNLTFATYNAGCLDCFDVKSTDIFPKWHYYDFFPNNLNRVKLDDKSYVAFSNKSVAGYPDVDATNKYVYALFSGKTFETTDYTFSNVIRVTSWDGKKRYKLILNRDINRLTVSQDDATIYGISKNIKGDPEIIAFDIKNLIK